MKSILILSSLFFVMNVFAVEVDYGFITEGRDGRSCFVGIDNKDYMYSGPLSIDSLSLKNKEIIEKCDALKSKGGNYLIKIISRSFPAKNPITGVDIVTIRKTVECITGDGFEYEDFLNLWVYEISVSRFTNCPR